MYGELIDRIRHLENQLKYVGTFDGVVTQNDDPEKKQRIKAEVKMAFGTLETEWASPIVPFAGNGYGMSFTPEIGDRVKIMFQGCDPNTPEYFGFYWDSEMIPEESSTVGKVIKTKSGHKILFNDDEENSTLVVEHANGAKLEFTSTGVVLTDTEQQVSVVAPSIALGKMDTATYHVVLGEELVNLLSDIISWLKTHTHPPASPSPQAPLLETMLAAYQQLQTLLSRVTTTE